MRLNRKKFYAWLKSKKPTDVVGESRSCHGCPIAMFYYEATKGHEVVISENGMGYRMDRGTGGRPVPWWTSRFMLGVDGSGLDKITAAKALEILETVPA